MASFWPLCAGEAYRSRPRGQAGDPCSCLTRVPAGFLYCWRPAKKSCRVVCWCMHGEWMTDRWTGLPGRVCTWVYNPDPRGCAKEGARGWGCPGLTPQITDHRKVLLLLRHIIMKAMATCLPKNESGLVAKSRLPASLSTWRTSTKAVEEARWMTAGFRTPIRSAVAESLKTLQPRLGSHRSSSSG